MENTSTDSKRKNRGGRPSKLDYINYEQVEKLAKLGATDADIAEFFGVSETTINNWKVRDGKFLESLKKGKALADAIVAERLNMRAIGYEHDEDKIFIHDGEPVIVPTTKRYPPDTTAAIFWLKNRRPDLWRDRQEMNVSVKREVFDPENGSPEEFINKRLQKG